MCFNKMIAAIQAERHATWRELIRAAAWVIIALVVLNDPAVLSSWPISQGNIPLG